MRYADAVANAPAGAQRFQAADVARLGRTTLNLIFAPGPSAPPLSDAAAALAGRPEALRAVASALPAARGERLVRLSQRPFPPERREAAARRLVRGVFWYLVYELAPERWDRLAAKEPIAPELLADLPADRARVLDVAAGSGRLASALAARARAMVAIEPSAPLRRLLRDRHPDIGVVAGVGSHLPVRAGWADLVVSSATFGPHPPLGGPAVLTELERCARPGGTVAMVGPEEPDWWKMHGYEMVAYPVPPTGRDPELEAFFGPLSPPHLLLRRRLEP